MKKIIMLTVVAIMTTMSVQAQSDELKQEVAVTYGWLSNSDIIDAFEDIGVALVGASTDNSSFMGPISVEYFYHLKPWLGVGGMASYGQMKEDLFLTGKDHGKDGDIKNSYITFMPAVKFDWLRKSHFGMYSKLAFGATLRSEKIDYTDADKKDDSNSELHVNWQVSLLGIEAGGSNLRGFMELGTGEQGIALVGIRYKF